MSILFLAWNPNTSPPPSSISTTPGKRVTVLLLAWITGGSSMRLDTSGESDGVGEGVRRKDTGGCG